MYDKPFETPFTGIIPGHPHAEGLVADYLFNQQGTAKKIFDCTQRGNNLSVVGATLEKGGLVCDANGEYASFDNSGQTSETSWNSFTVDSPIRVGNDAELSDFHCNGIIKRLSIHNKVLPEGLIRDISENPYLKYM